MKHPVVAAVLLPHAPIVCPPVAGPRAPEVRATTAACAEAAQTVVAARPDALVVTAPHGPRHPLEVTVCTAERLAGDLARFGAPEVAVSLPGAPELAAAAVAAVGRVARCRPFPGGALEYSTVVPLSFLCDAGWNGPTLLVALPYPGATDPAAVGAAVAEAAAGLGLRLAVVASGDMSHRLTRDAPSGYDPEGRVFDEEVAALLAAGDLEALRGLDPVRVERAGEDCLDSLLFAAGCLGFETPGARLLSYEGPFGVGYGVAVLAAPPEPLAWSGALPELARDAIRAYVSEGRRLAPPETLPPEWHRRAPVFVTLRTPSGELRGCIGSLEPLTGNLAAETIDRAIAAATGDPRFAPVGPGEVEDLEVEVSILSPLEPVPSLEALDPARYGVVVEAGGRRGVLLPGIEGIDTPEQQVAIARRKAGIGPTEPVRLYRFTVEKAASAGVAP
ncbi:MAG: AmmeMemoRadiSam system protein A [Nitrospirae bacterium]|nr:MAG: AmmeMemoRadiSam system protein A [Nitrospirota bacterium]